MRIHNGAPCNVQFFKWCQFKPDRLPTRSVSEATHLIASEIVWVEGTCQRPEAFQRSIKIAILNKLISSFDLCGQIEIVPEAICLQLEVTTLKFVVGFL